jgi:CRISPR/Cas system CMR-associated protein Cmr3 (group 5 of RAMP superfamily)
MKKIVKLTEADLARIVKQVIREQIHTDDYMDELERTYRFRDDRFFHVEGADRKTANQLLKNFLKVSNGKARFIAFIDCEEIDFSEVDLCQYPELVFVNLTGTPNNFEETQNNCYEKVGEGYAFKQN